MKRIFYSLLAPSLALGFSACEPHKTSELPEDPYGERMGRPEKHEESKAGEKSEKTEAAKPGEAKTGEAKPAEGAEKK
jgi:hypothetical protein